MSIILEHRRSKKRCVLIGPAFGMAESPYSVPWTGSFRALRQSSSTRLLAVADENGVIDWVNPDDYKVVYVSGMSPKEAIQASFGGANLE